MNIHKFLRVQWAIFLIIGTSAALSQQVDSHDQAQRVAQAIASPNRAIAHVMRDESRHPQDAIAFMRIPDGGRVLDIYAADGYYSYLLAAAVGPDGEVIAQNPEPGEDFQDIQQMYSLADALDERIEIAGLQNITHLRRNFSTLPLEKGSLDTVFLGQILHDFSNSNEQRALALLRQFHELLAADGTLIVIDHAGDDGQDNERLHRMPKETAIRLANEAGFTLAAESDLLSNPRDRRRRPVFDPMLARNTDRFLLRFTR